MAVLGVYAGGEIDPGARGGVPGSWRVASSAMGDAGRRVRRRMVGGAGEGMDVKRMLKEWFGEGSFAMKVLGVIVILYILRDLIRFLLH